MNVLAYNSAKPEKVAPRVEELLRAELASTQPLAYTVEDANAGKLTAGALVGGALKLLFGGTEKRLFNVNFNLTQPRESNVEVHMNRQGVGCHSGSVIFTTKLSKPVAGTIKLEDPKMFGSCKFVGEGAGAAAAEKLNGNKELLKLANHFSRVKGNLGGVDITAPRFFQIVSDEGSTMLVASTLPRSYRLGFKVSMDAQEFFQIASMIEAAL